MVHLVRVYLSNVWSIVSSHADNSYQNSIIVASKKTGIYRILCFVTKALFSFRKLWIKHVVFKEPCEGLSLSNKLVYCTVKQSCVVQKSISSDSYFSENQEESGHGKCKNAAKSWKICCTFNQTKLLLRKSHFKQEHQELILLVFLFKT